MPSIPLPDRLLPPKRLPCGPPMKPKLPPDGLPDPNEPPLRDPSSKSLGPPSPKPPIPLDPPLRSKLMNRGLRLLRRRPPMLQERNPPKLFHSTQSALS
ncbi:hypothetical protein MRX96_019708 [Rhipicephalus microplus]